MDDLPRLRAELDRLDRTVLEALAERARVVERLFALKRAHGVPLLDPAREAELLAVREGWADALGLSPELARGVFGSVLAESHRRGAR